MKKILAVFTNRNQTMQFASYLRRLNVQNEVVNTPRSISTSCGLSVVFFEKGLPQARFILNNHKMATFIGFFIQIGNVGEKYIRL